MLIITSNFSPELSKYNADSSVRVISKLLPLKISSIVANHLDWNYLVRLLSSNFPYSWTGTRTHISVRELGGKWERWNDSDRRRRVEGWIRTESDSGGRRCLPAAPLPFSNANFPLPVLAVHQWTKLWPPAHLLLPFLSAPVALLYHAKCLNHVSRLAQQYNTNSLLPDSQFTADPLTKRVIILTIENLLFWVKDTAR